MGPRCRRPGWADRITRVGPRGLEPGERDGIAVVRQLVGRQVAGRDFLDGELDAGQLGFPARLELGDRLKHEVVEPFRAAAVQG